MKKQIIIASLSIALFSTFLSSCKKDNPPVPDEQELITTVKLQLSNTATGFSRVFVYKVENGFGNSSSGTVQIDTLRLQPGLTYDAVISVLNEKANPVEDITSEILEKDYEHLFVFASVPASGSGSVNVSGGNKDKDGKPLNQTFKLSTGTAGQGRFDVQLMHLPTDKNGTTPATAGGETDLAASYPVILQ
jgi:hypothetical protein